MKLFSVLCLISTIISVYGEDSSFIVGGEDASIADFPYMASVLNFGLPSCGGSIITARSVLTVNSH
jgi:secreted trypsin-like serine protease